MGTQAGDDESGATVATDVVQVDVAALYNSHAEAMYRGARSVLGAGGRTVSPDNETISEVTDAVHAVVINLQQMHQRGRLTPREDWDSYLYKAARNAALAILRERGSDESIDRLMDDGIGDLSDRTEGADPVGDEVALRQDVGSLRDAMNRLGLNERRRRIVTGYYLDDMTDADLGRELGISGQRVGVIRRSVQVSLGRLLQGGEHQ